jgi:hypothetical protein
MRSFTSVQADPASANGQFTQGLLDPNVPVPADIKGGSSRRFGVYRNNVIVGLVRAMEANFPIVRRLLGEDYFAGFAREFVQSHPPRSPLMFEYGAAFSAYLEAENDLKDYPYLGDIARLEQQVRLSYHEANAPCLAAGELTQLPEDDLMLTVFVPHPAMAMIASDFAIHDIYRANRAEQTGKVENLLEPQAVLVTRPMMDVELNRLAPPQLVFFSALASGQPFGEAADAAFAAAEDFDLTNAISLMLSSGAFQPLNTKNP